MTRTRRRPRTRCRLPCEIVGQGRKTIEAAVVSLSEGGLGIEAPLRIDQGEPIQLAIRTPRGPGSLAVDGIVWNDRPARRSRGGERLRLLGCVVSDPSEAYLDLVGELVRSASLPPPKASRADAAPASAPAPAELPRSREPLPPPKPAPEESLPHFRVRVKQVGGPRTRVLKVRARSVSEAEDLAHCALADSGPGAWEILESVQVGGAAG